MLFDNKSQYEFYFSTFCSFLKPVSCTESQQTETDMVSMRFLLVFVVNRPWEKRRVNLHKLSEKTVDVHTRGVI